MATEYAHIKPENIRWARERAQLDIAVLAKKLNIADEKLLGWESGQDKITFKQAQKLADRLLIPFAYLFLKHFHEDKLPIPDLRTVENQGVNVASVELRKIIANIQEQQQWYKDYCVAQGVTKIKFGRQFNFDSPVANIVADMRKQLKVQNSQRKGSWEDFLRLLIKNSETLGILVMRQGDLGHHSKPLSVDEFRGFALFDEIAPVIFINQADVPSARLFTLIHELAHIWIGMSGVSDAAVQTEQKTEILCNAVAAEFLVPADEMLGLWQEYDNWIDNLPTLKSYFHVSEWMLVRRALTLNLIEGVEYIRYTNKLKQDYINRPKQGSGGPTYYLTRKSQLSERFSRAIVAEALSGRILLRDAGHILRMKPNNIVKFAKELGV